MQFRVTEHHLPMLADINECVLETHNCDVNAECRNTIGSFNCSCNTGYSGDGVNCSTFITVVCTVHFNCNFKLVCAFM